MMRALALTGLLLLVCWASEGQEAGDKDNMLPADKTDSASEINDSNVRTTEALDIKETEMTLFVSPNDSLKSPVTLPATPEEKTGIQTVDKNEKTNDTSNGNDTTSSAQSTSLSTSTLSTATTPETVLNITDDNATSEQTYSTPAPAGSSNETDYVANPDVSDNTNTIPQTNDTDGGGDTTKKESEASKSFIGLYIVLPVVAAAVVVVFVLCAVMLFLHKDRLCREKKRESSRQQEPEVVDCDQDLYSTVNYRHHGARADNNTLGRDTKLLTKMESEEDCLTDNSLDLDDKLESGRYVSPEGLVYVTLDQSLEGESKKPAPKKNQQKKKKKENKKPQYATLDFDKTGKLILKTDEKKSKKNKKKK